MTGRGERGLAIELARFTTLEEVREVWPTVASGARNLFATWEWISTWWRHFGSGRPLLGAVAQSRSGKPAVILPLYLSARRPLAILRFLGHGPGDWLGPIHAPEDAELAAAALRATLAGLPRWDMLLAEHVRSDHGWSQRIGGSVVRREGFPILPFQGRSWDTLLAQLSSNFREQVRRRERKLARSHELNYRLSDDPARLDADLELLFGLHEARWQAGASGALRDALQGFHRDFARLALNRGWLRLWVMELDGQPVAVWYGFRYAGVEWYYQAGRDPARNADSVGFVLLCHTIRAALQDGAESYWFLRGGESYKARFSEEDPGIETLAVPRGFRGRTALMALQHVDRTPAFARGWAKGLAG